MHSRRDVGISDDVIFPVEFDLDDDGAPAVADLESNGTRRSWRKACAAKRSIERIREEKRLKELLADTFDDDDTLNYTDLDAD